MLESTTDQSKQFNNRNFSQVKKKNRTWEEKEKKERVCVPSFSGMSFWLTNPYNCLNLDQIKLTCGIS